MAKRRSFDPPNLEAVKFLAYDTETTGVDWRKNRAVGHALCWGPGEDQAVYLPVRHEEGGNLPHQAVTRWLVDLFKRPDLHVVGHSLKFDIHMAANDGIAFKGRVECTQVNEALIDENANRYNLDDTASRYPSIPAKKGGDLYAHLAQRFGGDPTREAQIGNLHRLSGEDPFGREYAIGDVRTTWFLRAAQHEVIEQQELGVVWDVESRLTRVLFHMERGGVRVSMARLAWLENHMKRLLERNREAIGDLNVRSAPQIREYLLKSGVKEWEFPTTDKGNPSFPEVFLVTKEAGARVVAVRKIETIMNSFIGPLRAGHLHHDRVHTNFNQLKQDDYGVVTGRLSSNGPNMQQIPKRDKDLAPLFRMLFLPEEGHQWAAKDYNQQEYRIFADYTGSKKLLAGYAADPSVDIHSTVAKELGVDRDTTAKRMNFGLVNGMGYKKLAASLKIGIAQARTYHNQYDANFPEAKEYLKAAEYYARQRGWVRTKLKRRRRFPRPEFAHKAGNNIIQGTAADVTKSKMVEVHEYLEQERAESRLLLSVHDELDLSIAPGEEKISKRVDEIMTAFGPRDLIQFKVKMAVDSHNAGDWGRASFPKYNKWPAGV